MWQLWLHSHPTVSAGSWVPKSVDAQIPCMKWCSIAHHLRLSSRVLSIVSGWAQSGSAGGRALLSDAGAMRAARAQVLDQLKPAGHRGVRLLADRGWGGRNVAWRDPVNNTSFSLSPPVINTYT